MRLFASLKIPVQKARFRRGAQRIERMECRALLAAPTVAVDTAVVVAAEGDVAATTGVFSDEDGDAVSLEASVGTVVVVDGTFTWSLETDDGPVESQTVTITAEDATGATSSVSFDMVVENVAPEVSLTGATEVLTNAATDFTLDVTDPSDADTAAGFTFDIDWNGDGTIDESVTGADGLVVSHAFDVAGESTVIVTATDKDGGTSAVVEQAVNVVQELNVALDRDVINLTGLANSQGRSNAAITVVLNSTDEFDASTVDVSTVTFADASVSNSALEDVDADGDLDLVLMFRLRDTNLMDVFEENLAAGAEARQSVSVELSGQTESGVDILSAHDIDLMMSGRALRDLLENLDEV